MGFLNYPAKGLLRGARGLNLVDYLLNLGPDSTLKSKDMFFYGETLRRRNGFSLYSSEDWSAFNWAGSFEFIDNNSTARLLAFRSNGDLYEIQSESASALIASGLGTERTASFAVGFGSAFMVNGDDPLKRIDPPADPSYPSVVRVAGVPAAPSLVVSAGSAGGQTGDYLAIATAVIEDGRGNKLLESDWSLVQVIELTDQKLSGTVTPAAPLDSRVTHFYIYRTDAGGASPKYLTKVTAAAPSFVNVSAVDSALGSYAPLKGNNIPPPNAPEIVVISGSRCVLVIGSTLYISPRALNAYAAESFPFTLVTPSAGPIKAACSIPNPGGTPGTNGFFYAKESSCGILFSTDPNQPIAELSPTVGIINSKALALRGRGIFFVDRKRGVMWWPGEGAQIYAVGDRIAAVITGEGYQNIPANIGDRNVSLTVWRDMLLLTVRDNSAYQYANKVYIMNLLSFEANAFKYGPENAAVWAGPWTGPGFYQFVPRADGSLLLFDNANKYLSYWDSTTFKDWIAGAAVAALPVVRFATCLAEVLEVNKRIHQIYFVCYSNANSSARLIGEESRFDLSDIILTPSSYSDIAFLDIEALDISVGGQAWKSEGEIDWSAVAEWFILEIATASGDADWIFVGAKMLYTRTGIVRTYA